MKDIVAKTTATSSTAITKTKKKANLIAYTIFGSENIFGRKKWNCRSVTLIDSNVVTQEVLFTNCRVLILCFTFSRYKCSCLSFFCFVSLQFGSTLAEIGVHSFDESQTSL